MENKKHPLESRLVDYNNFYCFFSGGHYRVYQEENPRYKKIIVDLDKEAERLGIDTSFLHKEWRRGWQSMSEQVNKLGISTAEGKKLNDERLALLREIHDKVSPLFEALVKLGYTKKELMT